MVRACAHGRPWRNRLPGLDELQLSDVADNDHIGAILGGNEAYQGILNWNNYFYSGQTSTQSSSLALYNGESGYNQSNGNGYNFGVIFDWGTDNSGYQTTYSGQSGGSPNSDPYWGTFWVEAEALENAVDAYWWAKANNGNKGKYLAEVNNIAQGFIDEQWPLSNFYSHHAPWLNGYLGDTLQWYGTGYQDITHATTEKQATSSVKMCI